MSMLRGAHSPYQGRLTQLENEIEGLRQANADLKRENTDLKADNKRLGGGNGGPGVQMRRCVNCSRDLPDGPSFYPGYLMSEGANSAAEAKRHHCVYCQ